MRYDCVVEARPSRAYVFERKEKPNTKSPDVCAPVLSPGSDVKRGRGKVLEEKANPFLEPMYDRSDFEAGIAGAMRRFFKQAVRRVRGLVCGKSWSDEQHNNARRSTASREPSVEPRTKVDFACIDVIHVPMSDEAAANESLIRCKRSKGKHVPISVSLEEYAFLSVLNLAKAQRDASDLADECGRRGSRLWSVVWDSRDGASFFVPHMHGKRYSDLVAEWRSEDKGLPVRIPRVQALLLLEDDWSYFQHYGNVPGLSERLDHLSFLGLASLFSPCPAAACARRGVSERESELGVSHSPRWLVDSGSGWDLVNESSVNHLKHAIRSPHYCPRLWTANGVTTVDSEIPLYLPELDEKFVPFVMKDTPDVLTMGRRCMREGYSFHWAAYSNQPYFQKPDGTRILLKVDNYVPYLVTDLEESATVLEIPY